MGKWLARLSFSFLILAGLLVYQGYREITGAVPANRWRIALYFIGAGISFGLALRGMRERHREE